MIYFIEPNKNGNSHVIINAAMLLILLQNKADREIQFYGDKSHIKNIKEILPKNIKVRFSTITVIDGSAKSWIFKEMLEIYNLLMILIRANKLPVEFVFISSMFPIAQYFFTIIKKLFPSVKVIIGLHGDVEFIKRDKARKLRLLGYFIKNAFNTRNNLNIKYLIYGESIKLNLLNGRLLPIERLLTIDHPYIYKEQSYYKGETELIKLGSIGLATINKNTQLIFDLAEMLKGDIQRQKLKFYIIGGVLNEMVRYSNNYVSYSNKPGNMDRSIFEEKIRSLDYALYFYDNSFYKLSASGALFDAINFEKPIIALYNDYFAYYFEKIGAIGYLVESITEMKEKIELIINGNCDEEYLEMVTNMKNAKKMLSIDNIGQQFWDQVNNTKYH